MKTSELAKWLNLAPVTIRQWSAGEYKQYLSPAAQGGSGSVRNFTALDQRIIAHVARLKTGGADADAVHAALKTLQADEWRKLPDMPAPPPDYEPIAMIPTSTAQEQVLAISQRRALEIIHLEETIERLETELDTAQADRDRLQSDLTAAREQLGELRGRLSAVENERHTADYWLRWLGVVAVVALVIILALVVVLVVRAG